MSVIANITHNLTPILHPLFPKTVKCLAWKAHLLHLYATAAHPLLDEICLLPIIPYARPHQFFFCRHIISTDCTIQDAMQQRPKTTHEFTQSTRFYLITLLPYLLLPSSVDFSDHNFEVSMLPTKRQPHSSWLHVSCSRGLERSCIAIANTKPPIDTLTSAFIPGTLLCSVPSARQSHPHLEARRLKD